MSEPEPKPASPASEAYHDALQPAARELGRTLPAVATELAQGLHTISRAINVALTPLAGLAWGWDKIKEFLLPALEKRLEQLKPEKITTPSVLAAGPAIEALRYAGSEPTLRELYANLLATAMDADRATDAHPSFVEILRQLTPDEARLCKRLSSVAHVPYVDILARSKKEGGCFDYMRHHSIVGYDAACEFTERTPQYLENLSRLGLLEFREGEEIASERVYQALLDHLSTRAATVRVSSSGEGKPEIVRGRILPTSFGMQFFRACIGLRPTT